MDGKALAKRIRAAVAEEVSRRDHVGLATVLVGDDPASEIYIRLKHKALTEAGMDGRDVRLPSDASQEEVLAGVAALNDDDAIDGMLVQLPLPGHLDEAAIVRAVAPAKDVDGLHPVNAGLLYLGRPGHVPATPLGIMRLLAEYDVPLEGARAVVVGRSSSSASRWPCSSGGKCDGHDLPFAHAGSGGADARGGHARRRGRARPAREGGRREGGRSRRSTSG